LISSKLVLAIDTCSAQPGAALADTTGRVVACEYLGDDRVRAESVGALLPGLLASAGAEVGDVGGLGVVEGPGSYTGVRVGLALARGLALLERLPVAPISSLHLAALAAAVDEGHLWVMLEAGRGRFYLGGYRKSPEAGVAETDAIEVVAEKEVAARLEAGAADRVVCYEAGRSPLSGWRGCSCEFPRGRAGELARRASEILSAGGGRSCDSVVPLYVGSVEFRRNPSKVLLGPGASR